MSWSLPSANARRRGHTSTASSSKPAVPSYSNEPPVAVAGSPGNGQPIPTTMASPQVTLDGSASFDPDEGDSIFSYHWVPRR